MLYFGVCFFTGVCGVATHTQAVNAEEQFSVILWLYFKFLSTPLALG